MGTETGGDSPAEDRRIFTLGVIAALPEELVGLSSEARLVKRDGARRYYETRLGGHSAILLAGGDGLRQAGSAVRNLLECFDVSFVLGLGIAGALSADLAAGDLLAAEEVRGPDGFAANCDRSLLECVRRCGIPVRFGTLISVPDLVSTAEEKRGMGGDLDGPGAVDLESAAWVREANAAGAPALVIRAVFDPVDEVLPGFLAAASEGEDGMHRGRLLRHVLTHPSTWGKLMRMRRRMISCAGQLAAFAHAFGAALDGAPPGSPHEPAGGV